ncbi:MAG: 3-deoxy-manno-octulosonate cytidylyltransferase [Helicobacteraceae bacterium]|jgi:3-deoxy-manno-octulosonate cytidylyltransferase (CMP-KDO synthetase)|nr:3-deoxy-manno-octulosonate cytidylyltransferase [Helicobacteraceae bacterium]
MKTLIVIPARYGSTRFLGKPLALIGGKPMIARTYERAKQSKLADRVVAATDDERIANAVREIGGEAVMTSAKCENGTARLVEVAKQISADIYVNVQGDEPFIDPASIDAAIEVLTRNEKARIATLYHTINENEALNPNATKIALDSFGRALYFSRARIPYSRDGSRAEYLRHIGLYAYRKEALLAYEDLPRSPLEEIEKLEQLRYLQAGYAVYAAKSVAPPLAIDTVKDLRRAEAYLKGESSFAPSLAKIKLILTDVDGALSPPTLIFDESGERLKAFDVRDGLGVEAALKLGLEIGAVTGRDSPALRKRLEILKIRIALFGVKDKGAACRKIMSDVGANADETLFLGDDSPDLAAFETCGVSCAVADAPSYIKSQADFTLTKRGGRGAIREVIDLVLEAQGKLDALKTSRSYLRLQGVAT